MANKRNYEFVIGCAELEYFLDHNGIYLPIDQMRPGETGAVGAFTYRTAKRFDGKTIIYLRG